MSLSQTLTAVVCLWHLLYSSPRSELLLIHLVVQIVLAWVICWGVQVAAIEVVVPKLAEKHWVLDDIL